MYIPPSRRDNPAVVPFDGQRFAVNTHFGDTQRAFHGDRRAGPHPGGFLHHDHHPQHQSLPPQQHGHYGHGGYVSNLRPTAAPFHIREDKEDDQLFAEHTPGINFGAYEDIRVEVRPNNIPPAESFEELQLAPLLMDNIRRCRYTKPTPVQKHGIPVVLQGKDLMACAQTGSGKTAAYLIPAVNYVLLSGTPIGPGRPGYPASLILAPTRELAIQIYEEGRKFTFRAGLRCCVMYGGADPKQQINDVYRGCNLLVATPGRLWEMYQRGIVRFARIRFFVLDEADRMLDMGFEPQIRTITESADSDMPRPGERQTLMYSATFPREIQQLARDFLHQHYFLQVGRVGSTTENITQDLRFVEDQDKKRELVDAISHFPDQSVLVFVEKKRDADYLEHYLRNQGIACVSIHGDRSQREREESLGLFKCGRVKVLVATDVAARGLDIPDVALVLQFDLPSNVDDYVHRIGRTGRAGKRGTAIAFLNEKNQNIATELASLLQEANQTIPQWLSGWVEQLRPRGRAHHGRGGQRGGYRGRGGGFGGGHRGGGGGGFGSSFHRANNQFGETPNSHQIYQPRHRY